jgi:transcriptional regulator with XRE-family HTH domain
MISDAVMPPSIGVPKSILQGMPKKKRIRLAYMGTWNQRVKEAREAAKLSQAEFARRVGVRQPTVFEWEGGETKTLKGPNLLKVASVLGVTPEWLLTGKGSRATNSVSADEPSAQEPTPEVLELAVQLMTLTEEQRTAVLRTVLAFGEVRAAAKAKQKARGTRDARPSGKRHRPADAASKP